MHNMTLITQQQLKSCVVIDPDTGYCFDLKGRRLGSLSWNRYVRVTLFKRQYALHRLVWLWVHGEHVPDGLTIDHINGDKKDNRIANLRLATRCQNIAYYQRTLDKPADMRNIYKERKGYRVEMFFNGKRIRRRANTLERAKQVRDELFEQYPPIELR